MWSEKEGSLTRDQKVNVCSVGELLPMELSDILLPEYPVVKGCRPIDKFQPNLYEAIKNEDLEEFRRILSSPRESNDLNRLDSSGKTVLQVAADLTDETVRDEIIKALLVNGASLQLALINAVRDGEIRLVKVLLQFCNGQPQTSPDKILSVTGHGAHATPLALAACLEDFQIVKLLLEHGFTIGDPKNVPLSTEFNEAPCLKLGPAVYRLNKYRALASHSFIAASFLQDVQRGSDPVLRACSLSKELRDMAEQEYEFKSEYLKLSDGCEEFAMSLLNKCCTMQEIRCILETKSKSKMFSKLETASLNVLEFAVHAKTKKFVAHPYSQLVLNSEVYKNMPFQEVKSLWKQLVLALLASLLYPLITVIWCFFESFFPEHKVTRIFHSPLMKVLMYFGFYQTFLFLLAFTSSTSHFLGSYSFSDVYILMFVIGQLVDIIKDVLQKGRARFWSYHWNYLIVATVVLFCVGHIIWWIGYATLPDAFRSMTLEDNAVKRSYTIMLSSESFISLGILFAFVQNFSFFQVNASVGPLLSAFSQMLIDVGKFFLYFAFIFVAFAASFTKLYIQYNAAKEYFALGEIEENPEKLQRLYGSANVIFWSLFGEIDFEDFRIEESGYGAIWRTGMTLFALFNIVAVLVALNMLIAILNESYTRISENLDTEWKFKRTKMWLNWIYKKSVIPPPLSIVYVLLPGFWVMKHLFKACCPVATLVFLEKLFKRKPVNRTASKVKRICEQERREVIRHLVLRYLAKRSRYSAVRSSEKESNNEAMADTEEPILETCQSNDTGTIKETGL